MNQTPQEFIRERIKQAFVDLAEEVSDAEMTDDQAAGVPMVLFKAQDFMLKAWDTYMSGQKKEG